MLLQHVQKTIGKMIVVGPYVLIIIKQYEAGLVFQQIIYHILLIPVHIPWQYILRPVYNITIFI